MTDIQALLHSDVTPVRYLQGTLKLSHSQEGGVVLRVDGYLTL